MPGIRCYGRMVFWYVVYISVEVSAVPRGGECIECRPAGRFIASVLLAVAILVASLIVYVKLVEVLSPLVEEAERVLGALDSLLVQPGGGGEQVGSSIVPFSSLPGVRRAGAVLRNLGGYALLEVDAVESGRCRVYVNGTLVYDALVEPGDHVRLYISSVDGRPVASRLPPRNGSFRGGVVAVVCGGVEKVWDVR